MTFKERFEANFTLSVLCVAVTSFAAGFGAYKVLIEVGGRPKKEKIAIIPPPKVAHEPSGREVEFVRDELSKSRREASSTSERLWAVEGRLG